MLANLRDRLTYANVVSSLALFLVVGGGAAFASHEAIFSNDIVDGEVKNEDLGNDSVSTSKIQTQGVTGGDLAPNSVSATRIADEAVGTSEIQQGGVFNADLAGNSITSSRIADNTLTDADVGPDSVGASEVKPDSLTGAEVDEATLGVPRGRGTLVGRAAATTPNHFIGWTVDSLATPSAEVLYNCPNNPDPSTTNGSWFVSNYRNQQLHLFMDDGNSTTHQLVPADSPPGPPGVNSTSKVVSPTAHVTVQGRWDDDRIVTAQAFNLNRSTDCHMQFQALVSNELLP